ncbi:MAG: nicotinate (nicotinamide) nucleotide adenylyltransferase [Desulfovibrio sp.]|nr:nicotinate (nicotinamide) nucleotide adenylyltransferase [Desulfovibrio sp.]
MATCLEHRQGLLLYGGSFNPPHVGHLRLAVEAREMLGSLISSVEMLPCANPPHKSADNLLPFEIRAAMLEAAVAPFADVHCNRLEGQRPGASYTWDTLYAIREAEPGRPLFFLLGSQDYALLPTWRNGLSLPQLCHLLVAPRDATFADFLTISRHLWHNASEKGKLCPGVRCVRLPGMGMTLFADIPWMDISASRIRSLWLTGRSIRYLVPDVVLQMLTEQRQTVTDHWKEKNSSC